MGIGREVIKWKMSCRSLALTYLDSIGISILSVVILMYYKMQIKFVSTKL